MGKFDGILICTDLDGTLLRNDKTISRENLRAMEYFKSEGGLFTIVTGRMPYYSGEIFDAVRPNAPVGCSNGGGLYDVEKACYIWQLPLPESAKELIALVDEKFPNTGVRVNGFYESWFCKENDLVLKIRESRKLPPTGYHYTQVPAAMAKVTFVDEGEKLIPLRAAVESHPLAKEFTLVLSEETLYEILPKGVGKHLTVEKLTEVLQLDPKKVIAVGDYYNDLTMLQAAGVGVAVANAVPEVKAAADYVTVSNEEHAIAQVIADLEQGVLKL